MPKMIDPKAAREHILANYPNDPLLRSMGLTLVEGLPKVDSYTAHDIAVIIAELFGDDCACNHNGIDEWLPEKCELLDACPYPVGVACWEQWLKHRNTQMDGGDGDEP